MRRAGIFGVILAVALAGVAMAQTPCPSGTTAKRLNCLDAAAASEKASREATDRVLSSDLDELDRAMLDADEAIRARLDGQAAKIDDLLARVSALEAGAPPTPEPDPGVPTPPPAPGPAGGPLAQLGLYWWRYWSFEEPFIDLTRGTPAEYTAVLHGGARVPWADLWRDGHIDKTTLYPKSFPPNTWYMSLGLYRHGAGVLPAAYADTYVATWEGDADIQIARACNSDADRNCQRRVSANRVEATFDASMSSHSLIDMTRIGPSGVRNIKVFRKRNETLLAQGKILNPVFRDHARRYSVLRFMDPQEASHGRPFRAGDFARMDQATWAPEWKPDYAKAPDAPKYPPFEAIFRVSMETDTAAWVHVAGLPGAPATFNALIEPADPTLWLAACRDNLQAILASSDWAAYMDEIVRGLIAAGYPETRMLYLEPWNEVWNYGHPWNRMTFCARGVWAAGGPANVIDYRYGYGRLAAKVQRAFDDALARAGRAQQWTLVLAGQHAWAQTTADALRGFSDYWRAAGLSDAEIRDRMRYVGVSTASYYGGALSRTTGAFPAASEAEHVTRIKAAIAVGTASRAVADWYFNAPDTAGSSFAWVVKNRREHQRLAEAAGAFFLGDYEGESHENLPGYLQADAQIAQWFDEFWRGTEGERVTRGWINALKAQNPNAIISNYMSVSPRGTAAAQAGNAEAYSPWYDGYYGENNGRQRALGEMLR